MAPRTKRSPSFAARLTRKVGPLPVWAWAAIILGAYFLYTRLHSSSATSSSTPATPTTDTTGSDTGAVGSSSAPDTSGLSGALDTNTATLDQLTQQLLTMPSYGTLGDVTGLGAEVPSDLGNGSGPAANPTAPTTAAVATAKPAAHPTQNTAGVLKWGGLTFTTKAAFNSWAKAHGTTATKELSNHPQARAIYSTLR